MKQIGVNKFIFALAAVLYIAKHVTIQIFRARTTSNSQTHKHTQRDFTLVPLTRALALVYYYIHKVYTRKKIQVNSMHTSECKKTKRTAHRYRYISVHDASTMNRSVKTIFFVPYIGRLSAHALTTWHTSWLHLGSLLTEKSQQKLCVQCSCCNTWYSGVLGACAQHITTMYKSCTWRTVKLDVLSSEGRFEQTQGYNPFSAPTR